MTTDFAQQRHFQFGQVWYWGQVPKRPDMLAFMDPISIAFQRLQQIFLSKTGRPLTRPTYTQGGAFVVTAAENAGVTPTGLGVQWVTGLAFDGSQSTHGPVIGSTAPVTPTTKRYVILAVSHEFVETTPIIDKGGNTVNRVIDSRNQVRVYQLAADTVDGDDWRVNAALSTTIDDILADDAIPLFICERRDGLSDFNAVDIHPYDRVISEGGSLADEVEAIRNIGAFNNVGKVMTSNGSIAVTPAAVVGTPGTATIPGGEVVVLAHLENGVGGKYRQIGVKRVQIPAAVLAFTTENTRYVVRCKFDINGDLTLYQGTTPTATPYPDLSQTPGPFAVGSAGGVNQAFWSTAADIALFEVLTGANGSLPVVTLIDNHALSHLYYMLANTVFTGSIATLESLILTNALDVNGEAIFRSTVVADVFETLLASFFTFDDDAVFNGTVQADDLVAIDTLDVGGDATVDMDLYVLGSAFITGGLIFGSDLDVTGNITTTGALGVGESPGPPSADLAVKVVGAPVLEQMWSDRIDPEVSGYYWQKTVKGIVGPAPNTQGPLGWMRATVPISTPGALGWQLWTSRQLSAAQLALDVQSDGRVSVERKLSSVGVENVAQFHHNVNFAARQPGQGASIEIKLRDLTGTPHNLVRIEGEIQGDGASARGRVLVPNLSHIPTEACTFDHAQKIITPPVAWAWASIQNTAPNTYIVRAGGAAQHNVASISAGIVGQVLFNLAVPVPDINRATVKIQVRGGGVKCDINASHTWISTTQIQVDIRQITAVAGPVIALVATDVDIDVHVFAAP